MNQADGHLEAEAFVGQLHPFPSLAPASQPRDTTSWVSSHEALSFEQGVPTWMASLCLGKQAYSYQPKLGRAMPGACHSQERSYQAIGPPWFAQRCHTKASSASVAAWPTKHQISRAVMHFSQPGAARSGIVCPACVMNFPVSHSLGERTKMEAAG
jgi:hypothetical protein